MNWWILGIWKWYSNEITIGIICLCFLVHSSGFLIVFYVVLSYAFHFPQCIIYLTEITLIFYWFFNLLYENRIFSHRYHILFCLKEFRNWFRRIQYGNYLSFWKKMHHDEGNSQIIGFSKLNDSRFTVINSGKEKKVLST